jgi:hypothetical protein
MTATATKQGSAGKDKTAAQPETTARLPVPIGQPQTFTVNGQTYEILRVEGKGPILAQTIAMAKSMEGRQTLTLKEAREIRDDSESNTAFRNALELDEWSEVAAQREVAGEPRKDGMRTNSGDVPSLPLEDWDTAKLRGERDQAILMIGKRMAPNKREFMAAVERKIIPRILGDIRTIIENGWADSISPYDLYHCHLMVPLSPPLDGLDYARVISGEDIQILYHSREFHEIQENRNILSVPDSPLRVLVPDSKSGRSGIGVLDLNCCQCCDIRFSKNLEDFEKIKLDKMDKTLEGGRVHFRNYLRVLELDYLSSPISQTPKKPKLQIITKWT